VEIRRLGMLNEQVGEHHAFYGVPLREGVYGVPYPGAFLLDEQGVVVEKRFQSSYRERETGVGLLEEGFGESSSQHGPEAQASGEGLTVRAYLDSEHYRSMQRLLLVVELEIEPGLHVYGEPVPEGYVPLSIEVRPLEKLQVGPLNGPTPRPFEVEGLDEQFLVHEGRVRFSRPLTFLDRIGDPTIEVTVRYQACTASDCLPPAALRLELPIRVQNHVERDS
jgi:DsbC/DsbD-like thiol-disulfide interchange protein